SLFFFFFQAEDGIRDSSVTGVQTCALPICPNHRISPCPPAPRLTFGPGSTRGLTCGASLRCLGGGRRKFLLDLARRDHLVDQARSEERRVGKECRGRWVVEW